MDVLKRFIICVLLGALSIVPIASAANVTYEYDTQGRVSKATYENGTYVIYSYDLNGNLTTSAMTVPPDGTAPTAPATLTAIRTSHTNADLTWAASSDIVGVTGYRVERCTGATCMTFAQIATLTAATYSNTGLIAGTTYRYRVRATDAAGNLSGYSPIATSTALETSPPTAPASLTATPVSQTQINLSWPVSTDNVGVRDYRVERCTGASCTTYAELVIRTTNSYSDTGRTAGTTYRYRVRASDAVDNFSGYSPIAPATALDTTVPSTPGTPTFTNLTANSARANWGASTDNVGVTGYEYRVNAGAWQPLAVVTFVDLMGLSPGVSYTFDVQARDGVGNASSIATSTFSLSDSIVPSAPGTPVISNITGTLATATWTAATDNVAVTNYQYRLNSGSWQPPLGNVLTVNLAGLVQATNYTFEVRALDGANNSGPASSAPFKTLDTDDPGAPGTPSFSSITMTSATMSWTAATDNVGVTGYQYQINSGAWQPLSNVLSTNVSVPGVGTYSIGVRAQDAANHFGPAAVGVLTTPDQQAPTVPTGLGGSAPNSNLVNLNWSPASDNVGVSGYKVYRNNGLIGTSSTTSYADTSGLSGTTTYTYEVSAYDAVGYESGRSSAANVMTPDTIVPSDPSGMSAAAASTTQINLSWSGSSDTGGSGLVGYKVYRNGAYLLTVGSTSYSDTGLSFGTTYTYYVIAVDGVGNVSGASNSASATTPVPLQVSLNSAIWTWYKAGTSPPSQSPPAVATASGGAGGYTYTWEYVSGDTMIHALSPNLNSTSWTRSTSIGVTYVAYWRCRVSDVAGNVVYTNNVEVEFRKETGN